MSLNVMLHTSADKNQKVEVVTPEVLEARPYPVSMGRFHKPIKYSDIVGALDEGLEKHNLEVMDRELILARGGKLLIASYHLNGETETNLPDNLNNKTILALMASEAQLTACKARVGSKITVCDNLMISGGTVVISHKFTSRAQILNRIWNGIKNWMDAQKVFQARAHTMAENSLSDGAAAKQILEVAAGDPAEGTRGVVAFKYAQTAYDEYFNPQGPDTKPRTEWGLYNSWTRALRDAPPSSKLNSSIAVSGFYGI